MRTANLTGAQLDYWTARAEGVPADQLEIRDMPRPDDPRAPKQICVRLGYPINTRDMRIDYSTSWSNGGPLVEKHRLAVLADNKDWTAGRSFCGEFCAGDGETGDTPLIAVCRAVVRAAFGDEVEDLP